MAGKARNNGLKPKWVFRSLVVLICCVSAVQLLAINVTTWDPAKKGLPNVAKVTINSKNANVFDMANDLSPVALGPITNALDPDWLLHMNYTRYIIEMDEAIESDNMLFWAAKMSTMLDINRVKRELLSSANSQLSCFTCKFVINLCRAMMKAGKSNKQIVDKAVVVCATLGIQTPRVCKGIINLVGLEAIYVIRHSEQRPAQMCSYFLSESCLAGEDPRHSWNVQLPDTPKPTVHPTAPPKENVPRLKVLQISDTHYDPFYEIGANADCGEPVCCRADDGPATSATAAGKWGDYRKCDAPKRLIENTFQHISDTHKDIDYIMWTGDIPPHDTWNQTRDGNLKTLNDTAEMVAKYFKGIPIFPSVGNHESCPVDSYAPPFAPPGKSMSWLYNELDRIWGQWLPANTSATIRRGAFYSAPVKPGFRIISINGNYCSKNNFWLVLNSTDPVDQLAWLISELQDAEDKGEKVHIIGHIPPGDADCTKIWSKNYYEIISRYEGTIMGQFYGHTHYDEFEVFYDSKDLKRPVNVAYIAPSVTPWENVNPSYRIYYVDGDHPDSSRSIIDFDTWKMDLDEANQSDDPVWYKSYTARTAYGMSSLLPKDWDDLIKRMKTNESLFDAFHRNYYRDSPVRSACDADCQRKTLCKLKSARSHDEETLCRDL